jgi:hypothetical protein
MNRPLRRHLPVLLLASLAVAACGTETTELPAGLGPVALTTDLALPSACESGTAPGPKFEADPRSR